MNGDLRHPLGPADSGSDDDPPSPPELPPWQESVDALHTVCNLCAAMRFEAEENGRPVDGYDLTLNNLTAILQAMEEQGPPE